MLRLSRGRAASSTSTEHEARLAHALEARDEVERELGTLKVANLELETRLAEVTGAPAALVRTAIGRVGGAAQILCMGDGGIRPPPRTRALARASACPT